MSEKEQKYKNILGKYGFLGGRPVAFKSPKAMRQKMLEYLEACESRHKNVVLKTGNIGIINDPAPTTIEDFCSFAGITKTTFYDYGKKKEYAYLVAGFRQLVEAYWVRQCAEGQAGNKADFILKNAFSDDWKDNKDVILGGEVKIMPDVKVDGQPIEVKVGEMVSIESAVINIGEDAADGNECSGDS